MDNKPSQNWCLRAEGICKQFNDPLPIGSAQIEYGKFTSILGKSGCGKSTLLNLMGGIDYLHDQDHGRLFFNDGNQEYSWGPNEEPPINLRRFIGYIFQSDELIDNYSSRTNILLPRMLFGQNGSRKISNVDEINIAEEQIRSNPGDLSGGQRARIATLRSLSHCPRILLCDEPASDLDPKTSHELMSSLETWRNATEQARTVVTVSHSLGDSLSWADSLLIWSEKENCFKSFNRGENGWTATLIQEIADLLDVPETEYFVQHHALQDKPDFDRIDEGLFFDELDSKTYSSPQAKLSLQDTFHLAFRDFWRHSRSDGKLFQHILALMILSVTLSLYSIFLFSEGLDAGMKTYNQKQMEDPIFRQTSFHFLGIQKGRLQELYKKWLDFPDSFKKLTSLGDKSLAQSGLDEDSQETLNRFNQKEKNTLEVFNQLFRWFDPEQSSYARTYKEFLPNRFVSQQDYSDSNSLFSFGISINPRGEIFKIIDDKTVYKSEFEKFKPAYDYLSLYSRGLILSDGLCKRLGVEDLSVNHIYTTRESEVYSEEYDQIIEQKVIDRHFIMGCSSWLPTGSDFVQLSQTNDILEQGKLDELYYGNRIFISLENPGDEALYNDIYKKPESILIQVKQYLKKWEELKTVSGEEYKLDDITLSVQRSSTRNGMYSGLLELNQDSGDPKLSSFHLYQLAKSLFANAELRLPFPNYNAPVQYRSAWMGTIPTDQLGSDFSNLLDKAYSQGFAVDNSVVTRVESLKQLGETIKGFNSLSTFLLNAVLLAFLASLLVLDTIRKKRAYGVLKAIGFTDLLLLRLSLIQNLIIQLPVATISVLSFDLFFLPKFMPYLSKWFLGLELSYTSFQYDVKFMWAFIACASIIPPVIRYVALKGKPAADLMRYRV